MQCILDVIYFNLWRLVRQCRLVIFVYIIRMSCVVNAQKVLIIAVIYLE